jgi:hypothetical protein
VFGTFSSSFFIFIEMATVQEDFELLRNDVASRLAKVNRNARRYRRLHTSLVILTLICGILSTTLAADSAMDTRVAAPAVAEAATGKEPAPLAKGWKAVCGVIAVVSLIGTVSQGIHSLLKISEHQTKALDCAGRLDALAVELTTPRREIVEKVRSEYTSILRDYPEYVR